MTPNAAVRTDALMALLDVVREVASRTWSPTPNYGMANTQMQVDLTSALRAFDEAGDQAAPSVYCYGACGYLGWTVTQYGRVTHKRLCPHRTEPWCQEHPQGCPVGCQPLIWVEWAHHV